MSVKDTTVEKYGPLYSPRSFTKSWTRGYIVSVIGATVFAVLLGILIAFISLTQKPPPAQSSDRFIKLVGMFTLYIFPPLMAVLLILAQWRILHDWVSWTGEWTTKSVIGFACCLPATIFGGWPILIGGSVVGQCFALSKILGGKAWWWLAANVLGWGLGLVLFPIVSLIAGLVLGSVTYEMLVRLFSVSQGWVAPTLLGVGILCGHIICSWTAGAITSRSLLKLLGY